MNRAMHSWRLGCYRVVIEGELVKSEVLLRMSFVNDFGLGSSQIDVGMLKMEYSVNYGQSSSEIRQSECF